MQLAFPEASETDAALHAGVLQFMRFATEEPVGPLQRKYSHMTPGFLAAQAKRRHWLLAPHEIDKEEFCEWLPPAEWGSNCQGHLTDTSTDVCGSVLHSC